MKIQVNNRFDLASRILISTTFNGVYLVGGAVRDILLNRTFEDLDFIICHLNEEPIHLASGIMDLTKSIIPDFVDLKYTERLSPFRTFSLKFSSDFKEWNFDFDFVFSRSEVYLAPASQPKISFGTLEDDLFRRDFTINALASKSLTCNASDIVDIHGGLRDIDAKILRIIHEKSFTDDPIRIIRGIRFKSRLGFEFDSNTYSLLKTTISERTLCMVTVGRRYFEFQKIFTETCSRDIILELLNLDIFNQLMGLPDDFDRMEYHSMISKEDILTEIACLKAILTVIKDSKKIKYLEELPISKKVKLTLRDLI